MITGLGLNSSCSRVKCGNVALENPHLMTSGNAAQVHPQHSVWSVCGCNAKRGREGKVAENRAEGGEHVMEHVMTVMMFSCVLADQCSTSYCV